MASFGALKNSLGRLATLSKSMNLKEYFGWPTIDEKLIKPNSFYLQVLGYVVTDYCPSFQDQILLEEVPNIKTIQDKNFIDKVLKIGRQHLSLDPKITTQQFLTEGKWVQQKLDFLVTFCERLQSWKRQKGDKAPKRPQRVVQGRAQANLAWQKKEEWSEEEEDDDMEVREISVQPTTYQEVQHIKPKFGANQQKKQAHRQRKQDFWDEPLHERQTIPRQQEMSQQYRVPEPEKQSTNVGHSPGSGAVTREEYNQLVAMLSALSSTQTELVSKLNDFQASVVGWVNNLTAKVTILEENVKTIKQNL